MPNIITDDMLDKFVPRGTYENISKVYQERDGDLTQRFTFPMPENPADDALASEAITELKTGAA